MSGTRPTNDELIEMSNVFDAFLINFCNEYGMSGLASSGLILARLSKLAQEVGYHDDFKRLLTEVAILNETSQHTFSNNSTAVH